MLLSFLLLLFLSFSNKITGCYLNTLVMEQYILHSGKADIVLRHQVGSPCFFVHEEKVQITSHVLRCVSSQSWRAFSSSLTLVKCNFSGKDYDCIYVEKFQYLERFQTICRYRGYISDFTQRYELQCVTQLGCCYC